MKNFLLAIFCLLSFLPLKAQDISSKNLQWSTITSMPSPSDGKQSGYAGMSGGVHNNVMIMAGGANFPDSMPWKGGRKKYWDDIYLLSRDQSGNYQWLEKRFKLPKPMAYGASVSLGSGVLSIGGENENGPLKDVLLFQWDPARSDLQIRTLPDLPQPVTNAAATVIGDFVYLVGGETGDSATFAFLRLNLAKPANWERLTPLPVALSHAAAVTQINGDYPCLYLIGGRTRNPSGISELHNTVYSYDPKYKRWNRLSNISDGKGNLTPLSAAAAVSSGSNSILVLAGDRGNIFSQIETFNAEINNTKDEQKKQELEKDKELLLTNHPGFNTEIYVFNTVTNSWTSDGSLPFAPVTTFAVKWGSDLLIPSGEIKPGVRTPEILKGSTGSAHFFTWLDYAVVIIYLLLMVGIGLWTSRKQGSTDDYFRGGQRIPGWAAGLSIYGTQLSAITFMSVPAKAYATNWSYFALQLTILMIIPVITNYFIPFYRKLQVTSAYEYLQKRFNYAARALSSLLYIMLQLGRLAIVLLLPSLALTLVTGVDVNLCILIMGIITIFYTMKGGIEAVVWTDVAQVIILLGGALVCIALMVFSIDGSASDLYQTLMDENKIELINAKFSISEPTLWVVLLGGFAINVITYGADQSVVQKYLTTKDEEGSKKSLRIGAWMALPSALIFFSIGTLLYLFYKQNPAKVNYQLESQDAIFPWFIVSELPSGVTGLLIAAIFAAAMSTLSSSMNSVTTAIITDFYRPAFPDKEEKKYLSIAKITTLIIGVIGTGLALYMAHMGISSLWDQFNTILGLFTGGLGGMFVLGIFTKRANARGAIAGLILSGLVQYYISQYTNTNLLLYAFTGLITCVVFGYLFSLLFGAQKKDLQGLTIYKSQI